MNASRLTTGRFNVVSLMLPLSHATRVFLDGKDEETRRLAAHIRHERGSLVFSKGDSDGESAFDLVLSASVPDADFFSRCARLLKPGGVAASTNSAGDSGRRAEDSGWKDALDYPALRGRSSRKRHPIRGFRKPGDSAELIHDSVGGPGISLVVPAFNEERFLGRMLDSAGAALEHLASHQDVEGEIIVVDNSSTDRTAAIASEWGAIVTTEPKRQIATARNRGARLARGEFLVFSDADNILSENLLTSIYAAMKTGRYVGGGVTVKMEKGSIFVPPDLNIPR